MYIRAIITWTICVVDVHELILSRFLLWWRSGKEKKILNLAQRFYILFSKIRFCTTFLSGARRLRFSQFRASFMQFFITNMRYNFAMILFLSFQAETHLCRRFTIFVKKYNLMGSEHLIVPIVAEWVPLCMVFFQRLDVSFLLVFF